MTSRLNFIKKNLFNTYGFVCDPSLSIHSNITNTLRAMPPAIYFNNPANLTFHNLCKKTKPPHGTAQLLGLGPKFVIQKYKPSKPKDINITIDDFKRDARLKYLFSDSDTKDNDNNGNDCPPRLYIKSDFIPPPGDDVFEKRL